MEIPRQIIQPCLQDLKYGCRGCSYLLILKTSLFVPLLKCIYLGVNLGNGVLYFVDQLVYFIIEIIEERGIR